MISSDASKLIIHIDASDIAYLLSGQTDVIKNRKRAKSNFESYGAFFDD